LEQGLRAVRIYQDLIAEHDYTRSWIDSTDRRVTLIRLALSKIPFSSLSSLSWSTRRATIRPDHGQTPFRTQPSRANHLHSNFVPFVSFVVNLPRPTDRIPNPGYDPKDA
jgi:hypothetical protein